MTHEEGLALLAENAVLKRLVAELQEQVEVLSGQLAELEKKQKTPSFVNL
ncbi:MAG: hypothetical protein R6X18_05515 [Chloroflexota bacterium]|jgi:hypothetical protein